MGLVALPKNSQNILSAADEPVHMVTKDGFESFLGSFIALKHVSPPDVYFCQLMYSSMSKAADCALKSAIWDIRTTGNPRVRHL